ncbi:MAG: thermonuclease family protein [Chloroflexaceae bacterium]|nr:thermonuclease family protein [Chloroflexaceae bacterium]
MNSFLRAGLLGLMLLLLGCGQLAPSSTVLTGQVQRIVSGQTLEVLVSGENDQRAVRLLGISSPDLKQQPWGEAAQQGLATLVTQATVLLELGNPPQDRLGRNLAYVWRDRTLINEKLVAEGLVLASDFASPYSDRLRRAEEYARLMGYGIWNPAQPLRVTPAEFRKLNPS